MVHHYLAHSLAYSALEKVINAALILDPATRQRSDKLIGKTIRFRCQSPAIDILLLFNNNGINLMPSEDTTEHLGELAIPWDACIEIPGLASLKHFFTTQESTSLENISSEIIISGDIALGNECLAIFRYLEIDWEAHLSYFIGDIVSHQVGRHTRDFIRWVKKSTSTLTQDTREYLQYETNAIVSDLEYSDFKNNVSELNQATDKLEYRVNQLIHGNKKT